MSVFEHNRWEIFSAVQHPYKHALSELQYSNPGLPETLTNAEQALDWIFKVLYPRAQGQVDTTADLPAAGNTINDYWIVADDGDGKAAAYRWEQREGDAAAKWYKVYDMDWSQDTILAAFQDKTQDLYVYLRGRDERDSDGNPLTGDLAGQSIYGGVSAGTHLTLYANSGDGVGADTGFVQFGDNVRPLFDGALDLGSDPYRWDVVYAMSGDFGGLVVAPGSITDSTGTIDFDDENLETTGTVISGTLTIAAGSITDSSGAISFGAGNLSTTGDVAAATATISGSATVGTLSLAGGQITDTSGAISFGDENLQTTGTLTAGATTVDQLDVDSLRLDSNLLSVTTLNADLQISANGAGVIDLLSNLEGLDALFAGDLQVAGSASAGDLLLSGHTLSVTAADTNLTLSPNGTGVIEPTASIVPTGIISLGSALSPFDDLFIGGGISDGTDEISVATILAFRDATVGAAVGDALFWDGAKWVASNPDSEISHGDLADLLDDDHTQYALLAGRAGGQTLYGGSAASEDLVLDSTSDATKGFITLGSSARPLTDDTYDLGQAGQRFKDVYLSGEVTGLRPKNYTTALRPAASAGAIGRIIYDTDVQDIMIDHGGTWRKASIDKFHHEDTTGWDGTATTVTYTVDGSGSGTGKVTDARKCVWAFKSNSGDFEQLAVPITMTQTTVTVTAAVALPAGTYTLVGIG